MIYSVDAGDLRAMFQADINAVRSVSDSTPSMEAVFLQEERRRLENLKSLWDKGDSKELADWFLAVGREAMIRKNALTIIFLDELLFNNMEDYPGITDYISDTLDWLTANDPSGYQRLYERIAGILRDTAKDYPDLLHAIRKIRQFSS